MADNKEKLFTQFPPVSYETWRAKVDADLKGVPFEKKLVWRTNEGFDVQPMYQRQDIAELKTTDSLPGEFPYVRGTRDIGLPVRRFSPLTPPRQTKLPSTCFRRV